MPNFVSAQYVVNELPPPNQVIAATADDGTIWWMTDDCQQGDWLAYIATGGTIAPADPNAATNRNILEAPDNLTGGPTMQEVFNVDPANN